MCWVLTKNVFTSSAFDYCTEMSQVAFAADTWQSVVMWKFCSLCGCLPSIVKKYFCMQVCFRMPELSTRVEDWLQQPFVQLSASLADLKFVGSETKGAPVVQTKCAIEDWLRQIKCNPDAEDDDFDFINYPASDCIGK